MKIKLSKKKIGFVVAILFTVAAGLSVYFTFVQIYKPTLVVTPKKQIEAGAKITESDIIVMSVSRLDKHSDAVGSLEEAVGKFTEARLYPGEQLLTSRLINDPSVITGIFSKLSTDETYISFNTNEARWPRGNIKAGDRLTAFALINNQPVRIGQALRVISAGDGDGGFVQQMQQVVPQGSQDRLTIALSFAQAEALLAGQAQSKQLIFLPEHPDRVGGEPYDDSGIQESGQ